MRHWIVPFVALCGCATVQSAGTFTRPEQPPPLISGRAVAVEAVQCDVPGVAEGQLPDTVAWLDQRVDAEVASRRVELASGNARSVCATLGTDRALYEDAVFGTRWDVSEAMTGLVKQLAAQARADHVWIPLVRGRASCGEEGPPRDSYMRPDETLDFDGDACAVRETDLGLFLFDADGKLVWKSSAVSGESALATREAATRSLMANLPARAPTEGVLVGDTPP